jgi:hypothetical protein
MKCYSIDEESYNITDFGDLLDSMEDPKVGDTYYEADAIPLSFSDFIHTEYILEQIDDWAYEEVGEYYDFEFANVSTEAKIEFEKLISEWAEKHVTEFPYFKVRNSVEKQLTQDDIS